MSALRELTEVVGTTLEEARVAAAAYKLFAGATNVALGDFQREVVDKKQAFHRLGLPDKFERLRVEFGNAIVPQTAEHVMSINIARNCLVHRGGRVGERDLNTETALVVRWIRPALTVKSLSGSEREISLPASVAAGEMVGMRNVEVQREFRAGEAVGFDSSDLSHLCWTLHLFAVQLVKQLEAYGVECGVVSPPEKEGDLDG